MNTRKASGTMTMMSNNGNLVCDAVADFPGFPEPVWHDKRAITNILSFAKMADHFFIECNDRVEDAFFIHEPNGTTLKFIRSRCGICHHNLKQRQICFTQSVKENEIGGNPT